MFSANRRLQLTTLGHAIHPYVQRIVENAHVARDTAEALVNARPPDHGMAPIEAGSETAGVDQ